ncbi:acyl carrier protein [Actinospica robiniae]|uniref:acyl carrier protein n=1 Tax=Actinospica robiniae TaxID=304901 RepID=UPI00041CEA03|nr:phosphopantetheine-binding protein [Actinospica robiniae]
MDRNRAVEEIKLVVEKAVGRELPDFGEDTALLAELNLDSSSLLEVLMDLEDAVGFEANVDELDASVLESVGSLADFVVRMTAAV